MDRSIGSALVLRRIVQGFPIAWEAGFTTVSSIHPQLNVAMLSKRECFLVLLTALTTIAAVPLAQPNPKPVMGSVAIDWNSITVITNQTGSVRKFFESPTATLDLLECHVTTLSPGNSSHPPHHHPEEEIVVIREGSVETLVNGEWKRLGPGSVIFNASNVEHALRNVGDTPAVYHVLMWRSATTPAKPAAPQ
jgi:mannose-6-phosphate isomerase-like protein (cupin superfamily)